MGAGTVRLPRGVTIGVAFSWVGCVGLRPRWLPIDATAASRDGDEASAITGTIEAFAPEVPTVSGDPKSTGETRELLTWPEDVWDITGGASPNGSAVGAGASRALDAKDADKASRGVVVEYGDRAGRSSSVCLGSSTSALWRGLPRSLSLWRGLVRGLRAGIDSRRAGFSARNSCGLPRTRGVAIELFDGLLDGLLTGLDFRPSCGLAHMSGCLLGSSSAMASGFAMGDVQTPGFE